MSIAAAADAILASPVFTTVDALNILLAMQRRIGATPLQQPERQQLGDELNACRLRILDVYTAERMST